VTETHPLPGGILSKSGTTLTFPALTQVNPLRLRRVHHLPTDTTVSVTKVKGNTLTLSGVPKGASVDDLRIDYLIDPPPGWLLLSFARAEQFPENGISWAWYLDHSTGALYVWTENGYTPIGGTE